MIFRYYYQFINPSLQTLRAHERMKEEKREGRKEERKNEGKKVKKEKL